MQRRRNNVIIYNLAETSALEDEKWFTDLCKSIFNIGVTANRVTQLGKPVEGRVRPLLVSVNDSFHKEFIVFHSYLLRHHSLYKNIYISKDMKNFEHKQNRKLVQELKQRRQRGEKNVMIHNSEIVLRRSSYGEIVLRRSSYSAGNIPST